MAHWKRLLVLAALAALAPFAAPSASHADAAESGAAEDTLLLRLADALVGSLSAEGNATLLASRLRTELRGCGSVHVDGATVVLSAAGCQLQEGLRLVGPLTLQVHRGVRGFTVVLTEGAPNGSAPASAASSRGTLAGRR